MSIWVITGAYVLVCDSTSFPIYNGISSIWSVKNFVPLYTKSDEIDGSKVSGNFLIAKRSAIKAVLDSSPFPVSKESFPSGLILRVVFDPKTNVGVNNG